MGNLYLSFLGATQYQECIYCMGDEPLTTEPVRYVQEATAGYFCKNWADSDRVVIFTTSKSRNVNWSDNGHGDGKEGLATRLNALRLNAEITQSDIPDGHSKEEIWKIFECVFNTMLPNDRIVFDITHAYRYIPMLAVVVSNYAKTLKNVHIDGLFYGAFEKLGTPASVEKIPPAERKPPLLELTTFDHLLNWSFAVDRFLGAGDAGAVARLARAAIAPVMKASHGQNIAGAAIREIAGALDAYTQTITTCRGPEISEVAQKLKSALKNCYGVDTVKPFQPLIEKIIDQLSTFGKGRASDGLQAAQWCLEHNLIQQGYTILLETLISFIVAGCNRDDLDILSREIASQAIKIHSENIPSKNWRKPAAENPEVVNHFLSFLKIQPELAGIYNALSVYRNDINHAGYQREPIPRDRFHKKLSDLIARTELILSGRI